jgi:hypothetical protein
MSQALPSPTLSGTSETRLLRRRLDSGRRVRGPALEIVPGTAQVRAKDGASTMTRDETNRFKTRFNTAGIYDFAVLQRKVEIASDENGFPIRIEA